MWKQEWIDQIVAEHKRDNFNKPSGARVDFKSVNKQLWITYRENDCRAQAIKRLVKDAYEKSNKPDFEFLVSHDDIPYGTYVKKYFVFSTIPRHGSNKPEPYENTVPDYAFDSLYLNKKHGMKNGDCKYSDLIIKIEKAGLKKPITNKLGWIGHLGNHSRIAMFKKFDFNKSDSFYEFIWSNHYEKNTRYMSFDQQVKQWRFILDVKGFSSWTDRLKHYFFSNRVIFYVKRNHGKEFYFKDLIPWKHYVPIKHDFSDLEENYNKLINDSDLESYINKNAKDFALSNLKYEHAINNYVEKINNTKWNDLSVDTQKLNIINYSSLSDIGENAYGKIVSEPPLKSSKNARKKQTLNTIPSSPLDWHINDSTPELTPTLSMSVPEPPKKIIRVRRKRRKLQ